MNKAKKIEFLCAFLTHQVEQDYNKESILQTIEELKVFAPKADAGRKQRKGRTRAPKLSKVKQDIIEMHLNTDMNQGEIARATGVTHSTVNQVIQRFHEDQEMQEDLSWGLL